MDDNVLRFKGLSINKTDFEEKYEVKLSDLEWRALKLYSTKTWDESAGELRLMVFKHIRSAMSEIGYKVAFDDKAQIKFNKETE